MPGSLPVHQDQDDHLPQLLLPKHSSVLRMAAVNVINADQLQVEDILMLKLLELKVYL